MAEVKARILQCLCPQRHTIMAVLYESDHEDPKRTEALRNSVNERITMGLTALLGVAVILMAISDIMPKNPAEFPIIGI